MATDETVVAEPTEEIVAEAEAVLRSIVVESEITVRNLAKREIDVRIAPFGQVIETLTGPEEIEAGDHVAEPSKLLLMGLEHEVHLGIGQDGKVIPTRRPTGKALAVENRSDGVYGTFRVAKTTAGDELLALIEDDVVGGVSVEMGRNKRTRIERRNGRRLQVVEFGDFRAVSPTYQPAYSEARVLAARSEQEDAPVATEEKAPATGAPDDKAAAVATAPTADIEAAIASAFEKFGDSVQARSSGDVLAIQERLLDRLEKLEEQGRANFEIPSAPGDDAPDDFHRGDWLSLVLKVASGERVPNKEIEARVAAELVTADNLGVIPPIFTGDVRETIDTSRPFLESTRQLTIPRVGMQLTVPVLATRPTTGVQSSEKAELASTETSITPANFDPTTIGGYGDISLQLLKRSDPSYLELYLDLLAEAYGIDADDEAVNALLAEAAVNEGGELDPEDLALGAAWANASAVSRRLVPDRIWLSSSAVAAFIDAKATTTNAPLYSNLQANFQAGGGAGGTVSGLRPVHVPALDDEAVDVIVGPARGFGWAEDGTYTLQVDVPARGGRDVGLIGMLWYAPMYPAAFTTYTLPS